MFFCICVLMLHIASWIIKYHGSVSYRNLTGKSTSNLKHEKDNG